MQLIEKQPEFVSRFSRWSGDEKLRGYPFVENQNAPLTPLRRALPLLNLGLISSAGGHIDGTEPFDLTKKGGDHEFREIPIEVDAEDLRYSAKGYDPKFVQEDRNSQVPIERLREYEGNAVIGHLNDCWWSLSPYIPDAAAVAGEIVPKIVDRLQRYQVQAALLIPASRLCHQTLGIIARGIENHGIPTIMISVDRAATDLVRPPRTAFYDGEFGCVAGQPNWKQHQLRILDETLRWIETFDQPGTRRLVVELETSVEAARGER
jgi:D-proline reductase (dithiol) PrdB